MMKLLVRWLSKRGFAVIDKRTLYDLHNVASWANLVVTNPPDRSQEGSIRMLGEQTAKLSFDRHSSLILPRDSQGWYNNVY